MRVERLLLHFNSLPTEGALSRRSSPCKTRPMSLLQLAFILLTVAALSAGQILFKLASESISFTAAGFLASIFDVRLIVALTVYGVATIMWLAVLKITPLRMAYPFVALAFVIVPILAHFILGEKLAWNSFVGAALIGLGVWVSVWR